MRRCLTLFAAPALLLGAAAHVSADPPLFQPPHGMLLVEIDDNDKLFSTEGVAGFEGTDKFTTNAAGNTILMHDLAGTGILGGIAERDGDSPLNAATATSTKLLADDPGFFIGGGGSPPNILISVNFHNTLRYFAPGASQWTDASGEQLRIFDLTNFDNTGAGDADLQVTLDSASSGEVGTINLDVTQPSAIPGLPPAGIHAHVGYELSRPGDSGVPAPGAYMMELTLSGREFPDTGGPVLTNSDPIFVVFNNQLDETQYKAAVTAAEALPEPTTAAIVTALGAAGLMGLRRRHRSIHQV